MQLLWIFIGCATGFLQLSPKLWEPIRHAVDMKIQWTAFRRFQSLGCIFWADDSVRIVLACFWPKRFPESRGEQPARVFHTEKNSQHIKSWVTTQPQIHHLIMLVVGCWLFVTGMRRWTSMEWRWTGPLGLISTGKAEALSAGAIPFRTQKQCAAYRRCYFSFHSTTLAARMMAPEQAQCLERAGWCTRIQQNIFLAVEMDMKYAWLRRMSFSTCLRNL